MVDLYPRCVLGSATSTETDIYHRIEDISAEEERELEIAALAAARDRPPQSRQPTPQQPQAAAANAQRVTAAQAEALAAARSNAGVQGDSGQSGLSATHPHPMQFPTLSPPTQSGLPALPAPSSGIPLEETAHTTEDYMNICRSFIEQLRSGSAPWLLQRLNNTYGTMPNDPSEFSYWMALVCAFLHPGTNMIGHG